MTYTQKLQRNINLSYIFSFLIGLAFVIPIWVMYNRRILSFSQIALFSAIGYGVTTFLELPTGALADLIGRRKTIIIGWILIGSATIYLGFADSIFDFLLSEILIAIGSALDSGAKTALIFDSLKELDKKQEFPKYMAKSGFIHRLGLSIGSLLGGYLYQSWIGLPYLLQGLVRLLAIILLLYMIEPKIDTEKFSLRTYLKQTKDGFKQLFQSPYMIKLSIFYTLVGGITWSIIYYFAQPFATDLGFSAIEQSWIFSAIFLLTSALLVAMTSQKRFLTRNRVYLGFPLVMVAALLPGKWYEPIGGVVAIFLLQLAGSAKFTFLDHYANKEFLSKYRATAISALNMLVSLFYIVIVTIGGPIQDTHSTQLVFTLLGGLTVLFVLPSSISLVIEYQQHLQRQKQQ